MLTSVLVKCTFDDTENIVLICKIIQVTRETENLNRSIINVHVYNFKFIYKIKRVGLSAVMAKRENSIFVLEAYRRFYAEMDRMHA
jgi:hypothetical protein